MTNRITNDQIEASMRRSHQLRAEAFGGAVKAIGRGLRTAARTLVAMFG